MTTPVLPAERPPYVVAPLPGEALYSWIEAYTRELVVTAHAFSPSSACPAHPLSAWWFSSCRERREPRQNHRSRARPSAPLDTRTTRRQYGDAVPRHTRAFEPVVVLGLFAVVVVGGADGGAGALIGAVRENEDLPGQASLDDARGPGPRSGRGSGPGDHRGALSWRAMNCTFTRCRRCFIE